MPENFRSDHHALAAGMVTGVLVGETMRGPGMQKVELIVDNDGDYLPTCRVRIDGRWYRVTVEPEEP